MKISSLLTFIVLTLIPLPLLAYEPRITHRALTKQALDRSVLAAGDTTLENLGLLPLSKQQKFSGLIGTATIQGLLEAGAIQEDHGKRALNHFFDPTRNAPITVLGLSLPRTRTSPDWALAARGSIPEQVSSYYDAREYFYHALTNPSKQARDFMWGSTFATLGNVVHHLQDMAQPQHVRNDAHLDQYKFGGLNPFYNPSLYEKFSTSANVPGLSSSASPVYSPSNLSHFNSPRQFWINGGKGLAEYTNRGFVSAGTNLTGTFSNIQPNSRFPAPSGAGAVIETRQISDPALAAECPGAPIPKGLIGQINFIGTPVEDKVTGVTEVNKRTSTYSIFDEDLQNYAGLNAVFSLNRFNYCEAHKFLIPRAVAYSAGLINYFFRGKIDFVPDPQNSNAYVIKNMGPEAMNGKFALYYDADDGLRYPVPGASWNLNILKDGQADNLAFVPPEFPLPLEAGQYTLVFSGEMGEEKIFPGNSVGAVVAKKIASRGGILIKVSAGDYDQRYDTYRSTDLGDTWQYVGTHVDQGGSEIRYVGNNALLSRDSLSKDGGKSWITLPRANNDDIRRLLSVAVSNGKLLGMNRTSNPKGSLVDTFDIATSGDYGVSWSQGVNVKGLTYSFSNPIYLGNGRLLANGDYPIPCENCERVKPSIFASSDFGKSWALIVPDSAHPLLYMGKVKYTDGKLAPHPSGSDAILGQTYEGGTLRIKRSLDGGLTWSMMQTPPEVAYEAPGWFTVWYMAYAGNGVVLAYFHDQTFNYEHAMYRSTDYGATWERAGDLPRRTNNPGLFGMTFVGDNGTIPGLH